MINLFKSLAFMAFFLFSCGSISPQEIRNDADKIDQIAYDNSFFYLNSKKHMFEPVVRLNLEQAVDNFFGIPLKEPIFVAAGSATGFAFHYDKKDNKTYIMTNDHFCSATKDTESRIIVDTSTMMKHKDTSSRQYIANLEHSDSKYDLCVLSIDEKITTVSFERKNYKLTPMDELTIIGAPMGVYPVILKTYFSQYVLRYQAALGDMHIFGNDFLMVSGLIMPGHSGSPVFNSQGKVVGVIYSGSQSQGEPIYGGMAISLKDIDIFLSSEKLNHIK